MSSSIGILNVSGVDPTCYKETERLIQELIDPSKHVIKPLSSNVSMQLDDSMKLLVIPGGTTSLIAESLSNDYALRTKIPKYLQEQGNLWGMCAGAIITAQTYFRHSFIPNALPNTRIVVMNDEVKKQLLNIHDLSMFAPLYISQPCDIRKKHICEALKVEYSYGPLKGRTFCSFHSEGPCFMEESISDEYEVLLRLPEIALKTQRVFVQNTPMENVNGGMVNIKNPAAVIKWHDPQDWYNADGNVIVQNIHFELDSKAVDRVIQDTNDMETIEALSAAKQKLEPHDDANKEAARMVLNHLNVSLLPEEA